MPASLPGYHLHHPTARTPGGGAGDPSAAPGRRLTAGRESPPGAGAARARASRSREARARAKLPSSASRLGLGAESPASSPQWVWLSAWHRHLDPRGQRGQTEASPSHHPRWGSPESISRCPQPSRGRSPAPRARVGNSPGTCRLAGRRGVRSLPVGLECDGRESTRGVWEEAGLCQSAGSPDPGDRVHPRAPSNLRGGVEVWDLNISLNF